MSLFVYLCVLLLVFSVICMHQGVRVMQFQFSVCMYGTCGRIDNKADFDFFFYFDKVITQDHADIMVYKSSPNTQ